MPDPHEGGLAGRPEEIVDPLRRAAEVMRQVRERCVWSQRMTHRELLPYLIEESHEVVDAVERGARADLREELGDLLWQVLFHSAIAAQDPDDAFDVDDVAAGLAEKMIRRHPHVFGGETAETPEQVLVHWNAAKAAEKKERRSALDGIPPSMPALARAQKIVGRAERSGAVPAAAPSGPATEEELGDALLALVAGARAQGLDAERALRERIRRLEDAVRAAEAG